MSATRITFLEGQDEQPQALERIAARVRRQLAHSALPPLRTARRPLLTGIGASHAALAVPVDLLRTAGVSAQRVLADEIADKPRGFDADVLIGVSQGGRSTETIAAFQAMSGVHRVAVLNVARSPLGDLADLVLDLGNEPDSYASTIGFTGTIVALDLLAAAIGGRSGDDPWLGIGAAVEQVRLRAADAVAGLPAGASRCTAVDVVASGASRAAAEEGALLLREVPRIPSAASATRNYLHGEMESAGGTLHLLLGDGREVEAARTLAGAGHPTLLVTTRAVEPAPALSVVRLPASPPGPRVVLETVVIQELAAALAQQRGVPIESFVFANDDTKQGGVDPGDFAISSPTLTGDN
ncbi:SIS domain-containing protein [Kitasatospora sp. NPDC057223]|uniref:SIS domain-containing protein n=1 Tax=Kitasatospora sp. NPDC057223 TaxID=3346055 RepID=UPI00362CCFA6